MGSTLLLGLLSRPHRLQFADDEDVEDEDEDERDGEGQRERVERESSLAVHVLVFRPVNVAADWARRRSVRGGVAN